MNRTTKFAIAILSRMFKTLCHLRGIFGTYIQMKDILHIPIRFASLAPILLALQISAQSAAPITVEDILSHLPTVPFHEDGPQRYVFTCDYLNFDLAGNPTGKERVSGDYTRGLPDGKVQWANVRIAQAANFDGTFPEGEPQKYMDGFSYNPSTASLFKNDFFAGFPDRMQTKTLVWDVCMFEQFARKYFDRLKLNEPYETGPSDIALPGGKFFNRRPRLTWVGVSKMNGKMCAIIQYEAFFNKLGLQNKGQDLNGRSDYWGTIWVSLADKQIEKGTLNEGVLLGVAIPGQPGTQAVAIFRQATLERKGIEPR